MNTARSIALPILIYPHSIDHFQSYRYHHADFQYIGLRLLLLRAETCEIVSDWPLTSERDVWVEAKGLTEARKQGGAGGRLPPACASVHARRKHTFGAVRACACAQRPKAADSALCGVIFRPHQSAAKHDSCQTRKKYLHALPAPVTHHAPQGKYWVLLESDWDGSECLLSHQDGDHQACWSRENILRFLTCLNECCRSSQRENGRLGELQSSNFGWFPCSS